MAVTAPGYTRILVYLRRATQGVAHHTCAQFSECILDALGLGGEGLVECCLQDNRFLLSTPAEGTVSPSTHRATPPPLYKIMHPPFCPIHHLDEEGTASLPPEVAGRGVDVGVAVLLESSDHKLLLTRRASHMRTFPGVWVPPGGHLEDGESLEDAVLRELVEETGLVVAQEERESSHILGLWESVYPPVLSIGDPKRHHVVVYLHITLSRTAEHLNKEFKLCPEEVDAAAWLPVNLVRLAVWSKGQHNPPGTRHSNVLIPVTLVNKDGDHLSGEMESSFLTKEEDEDGTLTMERISTGSRYALSLWLSRHLEDVGDLETSQRHLYGKYMLHDTDGPTQDNTTPSPTQKSKF